MRVAYIAVFAATMQIASFAQAQTPAPAPAVNCLIVGGGPDREDNQVALESNVRYVRGLLSRDAVIRVLYTNGNLSSRIVQYSDKTGDTHYRASTLRSIDGPASRRSLKRSLADLTETPGEPVLLYFTGHGSPDDGDFTDNAYDLWGEDTWTVHDMKSAMGRIDQRSPVTLIMVQCFSGAFASVFFSGSTAGHPIVRDGSCGFFASVPFREAAGCTSEVDEADYHDFTTYFFGALTGKDRVGRRISTADYDHNGIVGMDEAFCYALINDRSIDTPTSTTDAYVRRVTSVSDDATFATPYSKVIEWTTQPQRAALQALSTQLHLTGEHRLSTALATFERRSARDEDDTSEDEDAQTARWTRFVRLAKTVILEHEIDAHGSSEVRTGLNKLRAAEHANPFVTATASPRP